MRPFLGGTRKQGTWVYARPLSAAFLTQATSILEPGFVIRHYGRNDVLQRVFDSRVQYSDLLEVYWDEVEHGPSEFRLKVPRELATAWTHYDRIDIHPFRDPRPWFSGYVTRVPDQDSTRWPDDVQGRGWHRFLERVTLTGSWQDVQVREIVDDVARDLEHRARVVYDGRKIDGGEYVVQGPFSPTRQVVSSALDDLATLAGAHHWGVDAERDLWFRPVDTEERYWKWLGAHVNNVVLYEDSADLVNLLHVKSGKVQGAGQDTYVGYKEDAPSQVNYGIREGEETAPSFLETADALRWGEQRVAQLKDPKRPYSIDDVALGVGERVQARGQIRLHLREGRSITLPIKRVAYTMNSREIRAAIDIGEVREDIYGAAREFWTDLERQRLLNDQTLRQVS